MYSYWIKHFLPCLCALLELSQCNNFRRINIAWMIHRSIVNRLMAGVYYRLSPSGWSTSCQYPTPFLWDPTYRVRQNCEWPLPLFGLWPLRWNRRGKSLFTWQIFPVLLHTLRGRRGGYTCETFYCPSPQTANCRVLLPTKCMIVNNRRRHYALSLDIALAIINAHTHRAICERPPITLRRRQHVHTVHRILRFGLSSSKFMFHKIS